MMVLEQRGVCFLVLIALFLSGCTQPVMRSMRLEPGFEVAGGIEVVVGGKDAKTTQSSNEGNATVNKGAAGFWPINLDGRYGWVSKQGLGIAAGLYMPGVFNQKITGSASGCLPPMWLVTPYLQLGVVQGPFAVSIGGEGGCGAGALFGGGDLRIFEHDTWPVSLSPAARWTVPWGPDSSLPADQVPRGNSVETGISLRVGFAFLQYWHEWVFGPPRTFELPASTLEAQTWHTFVLGFDIPFERL